jgi:hypothetical protein
VTPAFLSHSAALIEILNEQRAARSGVWDNSVPSSLRILGTHSDHATRWIDIIGA